MPRPPAPGALLLFSLVAGLAGCQGDEAPPGPAPGLPGDPREISVLQRHKSPSRDGHTVDPALTRAAVRGLRQDPSFDVPIEGPTYAQPLYLEGQGQPDLVFVATEQNRVYAIRADLGMVVWQRQLGMPVSLADLPCGNIDPLGITGTPVLDPGSRTIYLDAMVTPDGGRTKQHLIFALGADDGVTRPGWPVDVNQRVRFGDKAFASEVQNQRGGLALLAGVVYVPYGGLAGDCGDYRGWVVGVPAGDPASPRAWATSAQGGGAWAPGGVAHDGRDVYVATGNTFGAMTWSGGEAIVRLQPGPSFSGRSADYFAPTDWIDLDAGDVDIGGSGPVLLDVPGASPERLVVSLGKNGKVYLLSRDGLGGISDGVFSAVVASEEIINAAAAYRTERGSYVAFKGEGKGCPAGQSGNLTALRISATAPPRATVAWCAQQGGYGSPIVTTTDGRSEAVVWSLAAEGDHGLRAFDGDTGEVLFLGRNGATPVRRFQSPIVARGRVYVAGDERIIAYTVR